MIDLGPMPSAARMCTVDERIVHAPFACIFDLARQVEDWPRHLAHYRFVRFHSRTADGGGTVEMAANRPFGPLRWPTWWMSEMQVCEPVAPRDGARAPWGRVRYRHIAGITRGMEVEWSFAPADETLAPLPSSPATRVRIVHLWDGPAWPLIGGMTAKAVIGPVFVHGIASRTLAGLAAVAEERMRGVQTGEGWAMRGPG